MHTIRRENLFEIEFSKIAKNYTRIDELESAIDWFLVRAFDNQSFVTLVENQSNTYLWKMLDIHKDFPQLIILYKVDNSKEMIYLISVKEI